MEVKVPEYKILEKIKVKKEESALIIIDMQNDFAKPSGKLFVPDTQKTIPFIKKILDKARKNKIKIFFTQDWHTKYDPEFKIWGEHAVAGTYGAEIIEELKPLEDEFLIKKLRYDAFFGTPLDIYLRAFNIKTLIVTGTVANICVLHTVGTACLLGYDVILPVDAISAITEFDYHFTLRQIDFLYKGKLVKSEGIEIE
ncbi:MAG: isochorismatase family cysteine hydrolase [candidate division WOR-3 bacterium]|uniref:Cysteine hydrolase n=1 Tax=candidate division WOR-3 bacterium TaxID=2052148 RepID=A0A7V3ZTV2_UNCW3